MALRGIDPESNITEHTLVSEDVTARATVSQNAASNVMGRSTLCTKISTCAVPLYHFQYIYVFMYVSMYVEMYVYIYICIYLFTHLYMYLYTYMCV